MPSTRLGYLCHAKIKLSDNILSHILKSILFSVFKTLLGTPPYVQISRLSAHEWQGSLLNIKMKRWYKAEGEERGKRKRKLSSIRVISSFQLVSSSSFNLVQTCSNLFKNVQICSNQNWNLDELIQYTRKKYTITQDIG